MCGIAGLFRRDGGQASREILEWMNRIQDYRGPDGAEIFVDGPVGLAHRRLAIIDLSAGGRQPMTIEGKTVTYNGEIYNFRELRQELEARGQRFCSESDTEVLLRAYLEWGKACVQHFNGMFAFALWDPAKNYLFCARDRLGIKPFFFVVDGEGVEFASEIKALLRKPERRKPRLRSLVRYLGEGLTDDEWETFFDGVSVLPPAHTLTITVSGETRERYWAPDPRLGWRDAFMRAKASAHRLALVPDRRVDDTLFPEIEGLDEAAEALRALLLDSVRLRLRSDVPVGTCLSGGLDSSSVVACATGSLGRPIATFSSIYGEQGYNEGRFIDDVVGAFECRPHPVEPTGEDLPDIFDRIVWHQDEPSGGPGLYSQWRVMGEVSGKVKVLLDGQGGDELLGGYHYYFHEYLEDIALELKARGGGFHEIFKRAQIIEELTGADHSAVAERAIRRAKRPKILKFLTMARPGKVKTPSILHPDMAYTVSQGDSRRMKVEKLFSSPLAQRLYEDLTRFSIPALLRYEDRNSMAFSIEARVPFLDHRLVEFCLGLPARFKIDPPWTKMVLRKAMDGVLPASITARTDKMGYPTPLATWFRGNLHDWVRDLMGSRSFSDCGILDVTACQDVFQDHLRGQDRSWELWRILHTFRWSQIFLKGEGFLF